MAAGLGGFVIRVAAFSLIALPLLMACGAAEDNTSAGPWLASLSQQALINLPEYHQDLKTNSQHARETRETGIISLAWPVPDLSGDSAVDLLVLNITSDLSRSSFHSQVLALCGRNGSTLWEKDYPGALAYACPAGDLNDDGRTDVVVNVALAGLDLIPYSEVMAIDGANGREIWSRPELLAATIAYPIQDTTGDNASELLVHVFGIDSLNSTLATRISLISGTNGTEISSRIYSGVLAVEYPAGNFTEDRIQDRIAASYYLNESQTGIASTVTALDGSSSATLWSRTFGSLALAVPLQDLTGDRRDELVVYMPGPGENRTRNEIAVISGADGTMLWRRQGMIIVPP